MFLPKREIIKTFFLAVFLLSTNFASELQAQISGEHYNPKLAYIDNLEKLNFHIDSVLLAKNIFNNPSGEVFVINRVVEDRFYHGISRYSLQDNFLAHLAGKYLWYNLSIIVLPDDILNYQQALCSQQAIVMMEILKRRGYPVRKLVLSNHFILEVFYDNDWKVFDPDKEPTLQGFSHNAIPRHLQNGELNKAYSSMSKSEVNFMFKGAIVGKVNEFPAKNARLFHIVTKFISQYFLVFLVVFIVVFWIVVKNLGKTVRRRKKVNKNIKKVSECQQNALAN